MYRAVAAIAFLVGGLLVAIPSAATFTVDPTRIYLSARTGSALLTLRNDSNETLQFQLSAFAWAQNASGHMQLEPTDDVVVFPTLLALKPKETRRVRVGNVTSTGVSEKTYRIFVEELPTANDSAAGVRVLTKMGIPIFLRPAKEVAAATLSELRQQNGSLRFTLTNTGTVHVVPQRIQVTALAGSSPVFDQELDGWYVLAGGRREFEAAVPENVCARVTSIAVEVQFASEKLQDRLPLLNGACAH